MYYREFVLYGVITIFRGKLQEEKTRSRLQSGDRETVHEGRGRPGKKNVSVETMVVVAATVPIRNIRPYYMIYLCTAWAVAADDDVYSREEGKSRVHRLRRPLQVVSRCFHYFSFSVLLLTVRLVATVTYAPRHHSSPQSIAKQYLLYHEVLWLGAMPVGVIEFEVFCKTDSLCLIHSAVLTLG